MSRPTPDQTPLQIAQELDSWGLQVLPAKYRDKFTLVDWKKYQTQRSTDRLSAWFRDGTPVNFWVMCGQISKVVVVDADSEEGDRWWRQQLGDELLTATAQTRSRKGTHYWFRIPDDYKQPIKSWSIHDDDTGLHFDVRADRTGVIVPPSVHESGFVYEWATPLTQALPAPAALLDGSLAAAAGDTGASQRGAGGTRAGGGMRSLLAALLAKPATEGGRNNWMTAVAGHYAKAYRDQRDAYEQLCNDANAKLVPPLDSAEFDKTINSVWDAEHENNKQRAVDQNNGWLVGNGKTLFTQVRITQGDSSSYDLGEYANFDIEARGVTRDPDQSKVFWVCLHTRDGDLDVLLRATVLGDDRKLRAWLAGFGCTTWPPGNMFPREGTVGVRIQRYLESQNPPIIEVTETLGWNQQVRQGRGAFVTHDGIILPDGLISAELSGIRAEPTLLSGGIAPHQYGFGGDPEEARRVLNEVLTFHDEHVTSVFGAWWAACLLKPQILANSALFPFVGVQAPSESGKTNGFFDMMVQLNGSTRGEVVPTRAVLRNMIAAHNNGIVWIDDLDDPAYLMELLRAATSGGTVSKMAEDRVSSANSTLVAPVVISGEQLGLGTQKALLDRAIMIPVGSPVGRRSTHDPNRPQWDDVLELRRQYPHGLSAVAGWFVQWALKAEGRTLAALQASRTGTGRAGDKDAVLRAGAMLLDHLCNSHDAWEGTGAHATRVEEWLSGKIEQHTQSDNALTLELLPWVLREWHFPDSPVAGENGRTTTPAFLRGHSEEYTLDGDPLTIWVNTELLAEAWRREHHGRVEVRTQTPSALRDQIHALGHTENKQWRMSNAGRGGPRLYYRAITGSVARVIVERAEGR